MHLQLPPNLLFKIPISQHFLIHLHQLLKGSWMFEDLPHLIWKHGGVFQIGPTVELSTLSEEGYGRGAGEGGW